MLLQILFLVAGLALLLKGADWLVDGSSSLAKKFNVSDLVIGLTIVAFGTSAPEMVVNVYASLKDHPDIVYGNVIGSNNLNLFFILGVTGIISPLVVQKSTMWKEIPISLLAVVILYLLANFLFDNTNKELSRLDGLILLVFFAMFLFYVFRQMKHTSVSSVPDQKASYSNLKIWSFIIFGLTGLVLGGKLVVSSAVTIASTMGISEKIIAMTIVAAGTSLPELATSIIAATRKNNDIAIGNIIGSNIFNIFFILSISALVRPIPYNTIFNTDLYLLILGTVLLFLAMFTATKSKLDRWEAALLLAIYVIYTVYLINKEI